MSQTQLLRMQRRINQGLIFLCLFFLPTQLGKHFWPNFSFIYSLPIDYLSPTLYFWDLLVLGWLIFWLVSRKGLNRRVLNLFLFFILTELLSIFLATNIGAALVEVGRLGIVGVFGVLLASQRLEEIKRPVFLGLAFSTLLEGGLALYQFFSTHTLGLWILGERSFSIFTPSIATFNFLGQVFLRPYGTFPHPNVLSAFMVISLPLLVYFYRSQEFGEGLVRKMAVVLGILATIVSFSRAGLMVLGVEVIYFFKDRWGQVVFILALLAPILWIRYNSIFNFDYLSILRREQLNQIALLDLRSSPLLGVGLNNFINTTSSSALIAGPTRFLQPAHNILLLILAETGLVGFLGWLGVFGVAIRKLWLERERLFSRVLLFSWASTLFLGMFDHYFLTLPQGQRLLFLIWGLSMVSAG